MTTLKARARLVTHAELDARLDDGWLASIAVAAGTPPLAASRFVHRVRAATHDYLDEAMRQKPIEVQAELAGLVACIDDAFADCYNPLTDE
jgi:hypothetical protein